jgi:glycosyltransferase involved in cell wall biosynthesis
MPILLSINNYFYRRDGSEAVYLDHNHLLAANGWEVVPFSMHHERNPRSPWSRFFVTDIEFGSDYSMLEKLVRVPKVIYSLEAKRNLTKLVQEVRPEIAHCHSIYHHLSPSILGVLSKFGIPTVMTLHDLKIACPSYHMFDGQQVCERCKGGGLHNVVANRCIKGSRTLSSIAMAEAVVHRVLRSYERHVNLFISPCQFYIDKLVEWGWPREKFLHVPNFIDVQKLQPQFEAGSQVLYFGRLSAEKGVHTLIRAAAMAKVPVRIVGDGPEASALRQLAADTGAAVSFTGRLEGTALLDEIRAARATILPAQWYENGPMTILESYSLGKPVIGADIGGIPELIRHGETGWLFPSGSVVCLAALLRTVTDLPDRAIEDAGRRARALAQIKFSSGPYCQRILAVYSRLGARPAAAPARGGLT